MAGPYDVAIKLTAVNAFSPILAIIGKDLLGLEGSVKKLGEAWKTVAAGVSAFAGIEGIKAVGHLVDKGYELVQIQNKMAYAGASTKEVAEATARAWELTSKYTNIGVTDIASMANDLRQVFGTQQHANEFLPQAAGFMAMTKSWSEGHGLQGKVNPERETFAALKSAELSGASTDPAAMQAYLDKFQRALIAGGGNVTAQQILTAQRIAGTAWNGWSDDFKFGVFPALVQEQGARAGTMAQTSFRKLAASSGWSAQSIGAGVDSGLIDPSKVEYDKTGRPLRLKAGALTHADEYGADPLRMYENAIKPYLDKTFGDDKTKRAAWLTELGGSANVGRQLSVYDTQWSKLEKDRQLPSQVKGDSKDYMDKDWQTQVTAFTVQWKNLMTALGMGSVADATTALKSINQAIAGIVQTVAAHPETASLLVKVAAGLAVLLAVGGGIALFAAACAAIGAAPIAAIAAGIVALGVAVWALWEPIKALGSGIAEQGRKIGAAIGSMISGFVTTIDNGVRAIPGQVAGAISSVFKSIGDMIGNAVGSIRSHLPSWLGGGTSSPPPAAPANPYGSLAPMSNKQSSLVPPPRNLAVNIPVTVQMDSRRIAQTTMNHVVAAATYPTSASGADSRGTWMGPSWTPTEQG